MIAGAVTIDDSEIPVRKGKSFKEMLAWFQMCNPPASVIPSVKQWWYQLMLAFSFLTIVFYLSAFALLSWKGELCGFWESGSQSYKTKLSFVLQKRPEIH